MSVSPYLFFNGNCAEALAFYARVFDAPEPVVSHFSDMPAAEAHLPPETGGLVMNASLRIAGGVLMMSDAIMGDPVVMDGCKVSVSLPTVVEGRGIFDALADGGEVRMPFAPSFWAPGFGMLTDRFGIHWMISVDVGA